MPTAPSRRCNLFTEKEVREGRDAHADHAGEARKSDAQPAAETEAVATSTDSGPPQAGAVIVREMALGEALEFDRDRGHGGVCVGEDVPGVDAAASKQVWGVAVGGAIAAGEDTGTELNSLLAAESVEHTGAPPHQDTQAPVPPVGGMRHRKPWIVSEGSSEGSP
jgi:hypothetical protein